MRGGYLEGGGGGGGQGFSAGYTGQGQGERNFSKDKILCKSSCFKGLYVTAKIKNKCFIKVVNILCSKNLFKFFVRKVRNQLWLLVTL